MNKRAGLATAPCKEIIAHMMLLCKGSKPAEHKSIANGRKDD